MSIVVTKSPILLILMFIAGISAGCGGGYASQADQTLTEARSEVAGAAYVLDKVAAGQVSEAFAESSMREYAKAMQKTGKSLRELQPPPEGKEKHERSAEAFSEAQQLVEGAGKKGISRQEASGMAQRLKDLEGMLKP